MSRVRLIEPAEAPLLARRYYATEGETSPLVRALAQVPELLPAAMPFLSLVLGPSQVDLRTKELVILRVSARAECSYCVGSHHVAARDAGVSAAEAAALIGLQPLDGVFDAEERALLRLCDAIAAGGDVPEALVRSVARRLGDHVVVELVLLASATLMLNRFCTALGMPLTARTRERLAEMVREAQEATP